MAWRPTLIALGAVTILAACSTGDAGDVVAGTRLVTPPRSLVDQCQQTATELGFDVPCPSTLPADSHPTVFAGGTCPGRSVWIGPGCGREANYAFASIEWPATDRIGHLVIIGAPNEMSPAAIIYSPLPATDAQHVDADGHLDVGAVSATLFRVPNDSATAFGGHLVAVWNRSGHTYALGFHGVDDGARRLAAALLESMAVVTPKR